MIEDRKTVRYDRQLRLWDDHGQERLEEARVCLLNASATGCEALKNLVLPGIGGFTIVDGGCVEPADASSNFFLDASCCGQPKAEVACNLLCELNPGVKGDHVVKKPEDLFAWSPMFFTRFSVVIGTNLSERFSLVIGDFLWNHSIPFLLCKSYGLIGYLRVVAEEHCIYESRQENAKPDFMLDRLCTQLMTLAETAEQNRLPYLIIICKAVCKWRQLIGDPLAFPETAEARQKIMEIIKTDVAQMEGSENTAEALQAVRWCLLPYQMPNDVQVVLEKCRSADEGRTRNGKFWRLCRALRCFVENEGAGRLPLRGSLPDMTSATRVFVAMQNLYNEKADTDASTVHEYVQSQQSDEDEEISFEDTKRFCRNAAFLRVIFGRSLNDEYCRESMNAQLIRREYRDGNRMALWYMLFRAVERFYMEKGRYPGTNGIPVELDKIDLSVRLEAVFHMFGIGKETVAAEMVQNCLEEMCRFGASELNCVAAIIGGFAAHEVVKLLTQQYVLIDNTFVYDGFIGSGQVFRL